MRALCKFRGCLVIAEVSSNPDGGRCPECGASQVQEYYGWMECVGECGFAINKADWDRIRDGEQFQ
jgi:hypothetical protein